VDSKNAAVLLKKAHPSISLARGSATVAKKASLSGGFGAALLRSVRNSIKKVFSPLVTRLLANSSWIEFQKVEKNCYTKKNGSFQIIKLNKIRKRKYQKKLRDLHSIAN